MKLKINKFFKIFIKFKSFWHTKIINRLPIKINVLMQLFKPKKKFNIKAKKVKMIKPNMIFSKKLTTLNLKIIALNRYP